MEEFLLWILKAVFLFLSALWEGAVGMWFLGSIFPVLSYWNWVGIAFVAVLWVSSGVLFASWD